METMADTAEKVTCEICELADLITDCLTEGLWSCPGRITAKEQAIGGI